MNDASTESTIRLARAADAAPMAALSRDLIETGLGWKYTPNRIAELIHDRQTVALVTCAGSGEPSPLVLRGLAVMHFDDEQAHLMLLCVGQEHQRRGLGRQLLDWLLKSARVAGIAAVQLELRADNASALDFYRRFGFIETQRVPDYYDRGIDARRMRLALRRPIAQE